MTTFERVQELAKKRDKNLKELSLELGYSKNYLYTLKTKEPSADKLKSIADYFNVSTDYLLGRTNDPNLNTTKEITDADLNEILDGVMSFEGKPLTDQDREAVRIFLQGRKSN